MNLIPTANAPGFSRKRGRKPALNPSEVVMMLALYDAGEDVGQILARFGVCKATLFNYVRRRKMAPPPASGPGATHHPIAEQETRPFEDTKEGAA